MAEFGEGDQNQQYLAANHVGDHHWLIRAELVVCQKTCQKGQGGENQQDVIPCTGKDPNFVADDAPDDQKNNRNQQNDRHHICPQVRQGPQTNPESFIPQDVVGVEKQRYSQQGGMEGKNHESENRLQAHGSTAPGDHPVKNRFKAPFKAGMVVNDTIFFSAETPQISDSKDQPSQKKCKCGP